MSDLKFVFRVGELKEFLLANSENDEELFQLEVDFKATEENEAVVLQEGDQVGVPEARKGAIVPTIVATIKGKNAKLPGNPDPPGL